MATTACIYIPYTYVLVYIFAYGFCLESDDYRVTDSDPSNSAAIFASLGDGSQGLECN